MMPSTYSRRKKDALAKKLRSEKAGLKDEAAKQRSEKEDLWETFCRWRVEAEKAGFIFHIGEPLEVAPIVD